MLNKDSGDDTLNSELLSSIRLLNF